MKITMKITLSPSDIEERLLADPFAGWPPAAAHALAKYLDDLDSKHGVETEFCCRTIRCIYKAYDSALDAAKDRYSDYEIDLTLTRSEQEKEALEYLQNNHVVIEYDGGIIIAI